jgi:hypothetical protein
MNLSALDQNPASMNFLSPLNFKFHIQRSPNLNFWVQKCNIPGMNTPAVRKSTPFVTLKYPGEHIDFESLDIMFAVDEKLANYMDLYTWYRALGKPDSFDQYKTIADKSIISGEGPRSEIILSVLNSAKLPMYHVLYHDAFPTSISGMEFDTTADDVQYLKAACSFEYTTFDIEVAT